MKLDTFSSFLFHLQKEPVKVIAPNISLSDYTPIDLSIDNPDLQKFDIECSFEWENYLASFLTFKNSKIAFGGYLERRALYDRSPYFNSNNVDARNIHLGLDLWTTAETPVLSAFKGTVHSIKNNTNYGDYGPTVILKHSINSVTFYTLYGHLSLASLTLLKKGDSVEAGTIIGYLGDAAVNGDYAPHLHFQIIKDLQGNFGDYPGATNTSNLSFYKENCPDPKIVLGLNN